MPRQRRLVIDSPRHLLPFCVISKMPGAKTKISYKVHGFILVPVWTCKPLKRRRTLFVFKGGRYGLTAQHGNVEERVIDIRGSGTRQNLQAGSYSCLRYATFNQFQTPSSSKNVPSHSNVGQVLLRASENPSQIPAETDRGLCIHRKICLSHCLASMFKQQQQQHFVLL